VAGIAISAIWFPVAWLLGRRYESVRAGETLVTSPASP
jgi:hypothetical protein